MAIPLRIAAKSLVFAHRLLESRIPEGDFVGRLCATYVVRYADGEEIELPIRERFEIGIVPAPWGQQALLAWPDRRRLMPATRATGARGASPDGDHAGSTPSHLYLWPWRNPRPIMSSSRFASSLPGRGWRRWADASAIWTSRSFNRVGSETGEDRAAAGRRTHGAVRDRGRGRSRRRDVSVPAAGPQPAAAFLADASRAGARRRTRSRVPHTSRSRRRLRRPSTVRSRRRASSARVNWGELEKKRELERRVARPRDARRRRAQLGADHRGRRRDRRAGAVPRPFPLARRHPVSAARPPQPCQLRTSAPGTWTSAATCGSARALRLHRRRAARAGCRAARCSSTSRAGTSTSRCATTVAIAPGQQELSCDCEAIAT